MRLLLFIMGGVAWLPLMVLSSEPPDYFPEDTATPTTGKATAFSFPTQDLCEITIDEENLVKNYNSLLSIVEQIKNIEVFEEEEDLISQDQEIIYKQPPNTPPNTCQACTRPLKLSSQNSRSIYAKLRVYFESYGGSATVIIKSQENKPVGEDGLPLLALGKFLPDNPGVLFSKDKLAYITQTHEIDNCLCVKSRTPLSPTLQKFNDQLQGQQRKLSAKEPDLKTIVTNLIRTLTNRTITFGVKGEATLSQELKGQTDCYDINIKASSNLEPAQLPSRVTPASKDDMAKKLNEIIKSAHHFIRTLTHSSLNIKPSLNKYITTTTKFSSMKDIFNRITEKRPSNTLIIILLTVLTVTVGLLIFAPTLLLIITRRGIINIVRNSPAQNAPPHRLERTLLYTHA